MHGWESDDDDPRPGSCQSRIGHKASIVRLDSPPAPPMLAAMEKTTLRLVLVLAFASLASCGYPGAIVRTAANAVNTAAGLVRP